MSVFLFLLACGAAPPPSSPQMPTPSPSPLSEPDDESISGKVVVAVAIKDLRPRKRFEGVWLEGDQHWVVSTRQTDLWRHFDGVRVRVTGTSYVPSHQALVAPHFRVQTLEVDGESQGWRGFGPESVRKGRVESRTGAVGSKRAGESWPVLATMDETWQIVNPAALTLEGSVDVRGREVFFSDQSAHVGGPFLYVESAAMAK